MNDGLSCAKKINTYSRHDIVGFCLLEELALNLNWSWTHRSDTIWEQIDAHLWKLTQNPWVVLQTSSREKLESLLSDPVFLQRLEDLVTVNRTQLTSSEWFQKKYPESKLSTVAYFSMEFMLTEALPIYSGGLGNVAGDQLKAASSLGVPVIGVGLLYQQGYFRQMIDKSGLQQAAYPYNDPGQLPITPLRKENGEWLRLKVQLPGHSLWLRAWQVQVGRLKLYLLDSNDAANYPAYRGITSELYGGDTELRLKQEILLGIGGWRLFEELNIIPDVCHLNEGHAAFAVLERAKCFMKVNNCSFEAALFATRAGNLFTTHTAVPAGFDRFSPALIEQYLGRYCVDQLKISLEDLLALGRLNPKDDKEPFNMAYLAIRGSGAVNGVSKLHGEVSREIFSPLFPRWPVDEVPVEYVTNGVHMPSWDSPEADQLWTTSCGKSRWLGPSGSLAEDILKVPNEEIWKMRNSNRHRLVDYSRDRFVRQLEARGADKDILGVVRYLFDPHTLTLGFARRFATYKRPNMLLQDPERLVRLLTNPNRPVQLVIAGKAHPADKPGIALIQQWMKFLERPEVRSHVLFISDYDLLVAEQLVQGVDVWINTPRRPWEACGTSGMKVLVNGGVNLSELDGWWAEAYNPQVGWALGDGKEHDNVASWDLQEASALYSLLENEVIPEFYERDIAGIPLKWVERIRMSMAHLTPQYSSSRAVREYTEGYYLPLAQKYHSRAAKNGTLAIELLQKKEEFLEHWNAIRFNDVKVATNVGELQFDARIYLDGLNKDYVRVEVYAEGLDKGPPVVIPMIPLGQLTSDPTMHRYQLSIKTDRKSHDYTLRIVPSVLELASPLELSNILWQN